MKAYSMDLRERVVHAVDNGCSRKQIMELFGISSATIKRYLKQRRETGEVQVKSIPGRPSKKFAPLQAGLTPQLQRYPDATLAFHCQIWEQDQGQKVSTTTMGRAIRRLGWTRKKRHWEPPNAMKRHGQPGESSSNRSRLRTLL